MKIKKYYAKDMAEAMDLIRRELGPDAVILSSHPVKKKGWRYLFSKPIVEVVAGYEQKPEKPKRQKQKAQDPLLPPPELLSPDALADALNAIAEAGENTNKEKQATPEKTEKMAQAIKEKNQELEQEANEQQSYSFRDAAGYKPKKQVKKQTSTNNQSDNKIVEIDNQLDELNKTIGKFMNRFQHVKKDITYDYDEELEEILLNLIENGVSEQLAHSLAQEAQKIINKKEAHAKDVMEHLLKELIGEPEDIITKKFERTIVLIVGPTGVGKTTSLVKLAAHFVVNKKLKVGLINSDTYRIAAKEQLETYAEILDIPLNIIYHAEDIEKALEAQEDRDIIFVDTAGKRPGDEEHKNYVEKLLKLSSAKEIMLTISAPTSPVACKEIINSYSFLDKYKLMITKTDETSSLGIIANACDYAKQPLSYLADGQSVPDDIKLADVNKLVKDLIK